MPKKKEKLMIIDGNALIHRSFHALPPTMTTKDGTVVNAVYGFASFLIKAMRDLKPEYVVLTLDKKGPTFRHEKFKEYKAKRVKAPDELYAQIPLVQDLAQAFNIPVFAKEGFEADDLIGTIVSMIGGERQKAKGERKEIEVIIVTGDKDTLQLVDENVKVYSMSRGVTDSVLYDEAGVMEKLGVRPDQVVDYKALRGDPSDNIPGVTGIGEKIAVELLKEFGTLDKLYETVDKGEEKGKSGKGKGENSIKPRIFDLLLEHKNNAYLSQELATIKRDVPIEFDLEATRFRDLDKDRVVSALTELEFKSLLPRVQAMFEEAMHETKAEKAERGQEKFARNQAEFDYVLVDDEKKFSEFYKKLQAEKSFSFDTETSGLDPLTCDLLGVSFSWEKGAAYFVQLRITNCELRIDNKQTSLFGGFEKKNDVSQAAVWLSRLKLVLEDEKSEKFAHNGKYDIRVLRAFGIEVKNFSFDTMIAAYLLNPGSRSLSLDNLTFSELGFEKISKKDLLGVGQKQIAFAEVAKEKLSLYSCEDADYSYQLAKKLAPRLKAENLEKLFVEIEMPLLSVLSRMEDSGICLDKDFLSDMSKSLAKKIKALEKMIHEQAGQAFNIKSTLQLKEILFEKLGLSTESVKKTKTGFSTAADELDKLKDLHPIIRLIQEYREVTKLASTYVDALPELVNKKTGRIHTSYNQTIAATGRLSSTDPNLQNIPIRTELGREIRKAFVAPSGFKLLALDYSQIELHLAAHMSGDPKMIQAFQNGADIHTQTAAEINQVSPSAVDAQMRREAKAVNFGILYGQGAHGLAQAADIPYVRARVFIDNYFSVFSDVKKYIDRQIKEAQEKGYVETLLGRRRYLPDINSTVMQVKKAAERMAMNTPLQGTAADMIKIAMIFVNQQVCSPDVKMLLTVHDEIVLEVKDSLIEKTAKEVKKIMEEVIKLTVPVVVDVKVGENWGEMENIPL